MMPVYPTMFSELRHHPRYTISLRPNNTLPQFVNSDWPDRANYQRERAILQKLYVPVATFAS